MPSGSAVCLSPRSTMSSDEPYVACRSRTTCPCVLREISVPARGVRWGAGHLRADDGLPELVDGALVEALEARVVGMLDHR